MLVNGEKVFEEKELFHNDRLILGTNSFFLLKYPGAELLSPNKTKGEEFDWEFAQAELVALTYREKQQKIVEAEMQQKRESIL